MASSMLVVERKLTVSCWGRARRGRAMKQKEKSRAKAAVLPVISWPGIFFTALALLEFWIASR